MSSFQAAQRKLIGIISLFCILVLSTTLAAQESFEINEGLAGSWFNAATSGQGMLFDVIPSQELLFVAWFTYETSSTSSKLGAAEHRWLTALGPYAGNRAELELFLTEGGVFDDPAAVTDTPVGTLVITFDGCTLATAEYDIPGDALMGQIDLERITPDVLCELLSNPPVEEKTVTITYIANEGVVVSNGDTAIAVDAMGSFTGWIGSSATTQNQLIAGLLPFDNIVLTAVTHNHGDHYNSSSINSFLAGDGTRQCFFPTQGRGAITGQSQILDISPPRFGTSVHDFDGFRVTVINTRHFDQFGNDFSNVENYAYLIEIEGRQILHLGDIDYAEDNFTALQGALSGPLDVVIMPTFNTLINAANRDLVNQFLAPLQVIGAHFQVGPLALETQQFLALFPEGLVFDQSLEQFQVP